MELRLIDILGEDSAKANKAVMAAGLQDRMWDASMRFYDVQGQENTGYVTDRFLRGVLGASTASTSPRAMKRPDFGRGARRARRRLQPAATLRGELDADADDRHRRHRPDAGRQRRVPADKLAQAINATLLKTV